MDDKTIVLIADKGLKGTSNILNFNVGDGLADVLPTPVLVAAPGPLRHVALLARRGRGRRHHERRRGHRLLTAARF